MSAENEKTAAAAAAAGAEEAQLQDETVLLMGIMGRMSADAAHVSRQLERGLRVRAALAETRLQLIRESISRQLSYPFVPSPEAISDALWPEEGMVRSMAARKVSEEEAEIQALSEPPASPEAGP